MLPVALEGAAGGGVEAVGVAGIEEVVTGAGCVGVGVGDDEVAVYENLPVTG